MKTIQETEPINFVLQVKMSGNAIPYEYGFTTEQEARDAREEWEYSDNPRLRWTDIKKATSKQYVQHHKKQGTNINPPLQP